MELKGNNLEKRLSQSEKGEETEKEKTGKEILLEKLLNEVSLESLADIVLSDSLPKKEKEEARNKIKERLINEYNRSEIKNHFIDSMLLNTFLDEEKLVKEVDNWLWRIRLDELLKIIAGAVASKEKKKKIIRELWETAKKRIEKELKDKKVLRPEDISNLSLLYISLDGKDFPKESEIVEKIEKMFVEKYEKKDD